MELANKNVIIVGRGISGQGAYQALEGICRPYFYVEDDFEPCALKNIAPKSGVAPDLAVISPGIAFHPIIDYAYQNNIPVIDELELGYMLNNSPIVAITGTNGKTTVTRLIGEILATQLSTIICGNIGQAFSLKAQTPHEIAVVEASSFQLERCDKFCPFIAIITNITPDHLDRHGSMQGYINAKLNIFKNQTANDYLILPSELSELKKAASSRVIFSDKACKIENDCIFFLDEPIIDINEINLMGNHNLLNVCQAICAAKLLNIKNENIINAIKNFKLDPHRLSLVGIKQGKSWFNDSKATNIDACLKACLSMKGQTALILGGSDKGYSYDQLFIDLPKNIAPIFVFGQTADKLIDAAKKQGIEPIRVDNLENAVELAAKTDVLNVLLAPAAASFDIYHDYKERGGHFEKLVNSL